MGGCVGVWVGRRLGGWVDGWVERVGSGKPLVLSGQALVLSGKPLVLSGKSQAAASYFSKNAFFQTALVKNMRSELWE